MTIDQYRALSPEEQRLYRLSVLCHEAWVRNQREQRHVRDLQRQVAEIEAGEPTVPWETIKRECGLNGKGDETDGH